MKISPKKNRVYKAAIRGQHLTNNSRRKIRGQSYNLHFRIVMSSIKKLALQTKDRKGHGAWSIE
jgi:hypothetical protein